MTFWYNAPKGESKFAELNCNDYANTDARFSFEEFQVSITDEAYIFYGLVHTASDVKQAKNDSFKLENQLVAFSIHRKDYTKRKTVDGTWKDVPVTLTRAEQAVGKVIELLGITPEKTYKGTINLGLSVNDERVLLEGLKANGQPASDEMKRDTAEGVMLIEEREPVALKSATYSPAKKGAWSGGGSKGQTEAERLNDRWEFFKKQIKYTAAECESVEDFTLAFNALDDKDRAIVESSLRTLAMLIK